MRQLLLVLFIFVLSLLGLVALFNTITNTSKQSNIALAPDLPTYPNAEAHLTKALEWRSSADSTGWAQMPAFHAWLRQQYPLLFNNPNIEWQEFGAQNWVAKWIGRKADLAPIVWMASPQVAVPNSAQRPLWSVAPFSGNLTEDYLYGQGSQGSKAAMIAMLEVLHDLVEKERLPDRTIYLAFPFPAQVGEAQILKALAQAGTPAEYVLQTGGGIAEGLFWDLSPSVALLGVGQLASAQITLARIHPKMDWQPWLERLQMALPLGNLKTAIVRELIQQISPELPFQQRFVFSNAWLLAWRKDGYFYSGSLPQSLVGPFARFLPDALPDTDTTILQITASQLNAATLAAIWHTLQSDSVQVLDDWKQQEGFATASTESRSYRLLGNTCKEIFPHLVTAPVWVNPSGHEYQTAFQAPIFYFYPLVHDQASWKQAQGGITERIRRQNYQRLLQFYHQLLTNSI